MNGMSDTNHDIYWIRYRDSRDSLTLSQSDQKRMNEQLLHSFSLLHIMKPYDEKPRNPKQKIQHSRSRNTAKRLNDTMHQLSYLLDVRALKVYIIQNALLSYVCNSKIVSTVRLASQKFSRSFLCIIFTY